MRPRLLGSILLGALVLTVGACGGGSSTRAHARAGAPGSRPSHLYRVTLTGAAESPRGAPHGVGIAIIAFHGDSQVCWRFAHLHGFTHATVAHIQAGAKGHAGRIVVPLSTGTRLHHRGCVGLSPSLTKAIVAAPDRYYVNVHSALYPSGAVRGQL